MLPSLNGVGTQITWAGSLDLVDWLPVEKAVSIADLTQQGGSAKI